MAGNGRVRRKKECADKDSSNVLCGEGERWSLSLPFMVNSQVRVEVGALKQATQDIGENHWVGYTLFNYCTSHGTVFD